MSYKMNFNFLPLLQSYQTGGYKKTGIHIAFFLFSLYEPTPSTSYH